ncbi:hypothetical protein BGZ98_008849 [Dissophora globulifera]|nr:hypothetical protein BGZ98_008849 [Dissophora globulifera]
MAGPAIGPKSAARPRPGLGGAPLTIQTGFANGHTPQHTLRQSKSHQQPLRQSYDSRRTSTPSPALVGRRLIRSDSDGAGFANQQAAANKTQNGSSRPLSRIGMQNMSTTTQTATNIVNGRASPAMGMYNAHNGEFGFQHPSHSEHYHTYHLNNSASRRISGSWDDNQNVYERLASVHTQASQARILATRHNTYPTQGSTPAGGSMMASGGNMASPGFQQIQQGQHLLNQQGGRGGPNERMRMHRPSVDGLMLDGGDAHGDGEGADGQAERWSSNSSSSVTSVSTTTSTMTAATNSPTMEEPASSSSHGAIHEQMQSLPKAEVARVF